MKILYLHPKSWIGEYELIKYFFSLGHSVCVLEEDRKISPSYCRRTYFLEQGDQIPTLWYNPGKGAVKALTFGVDKFFKNNFNGRNLGHRIWVVNKAIRLFKPEVVVCSDGFSYGIPAAFLKRLNHFAARLILSYIGGDIMDLPLAQYGKRRTKITDWLIKQSLKGDAYFRPVSPLLENILIGDGAPRSRIAVIPCHLRFTQDDIRAIRKRRDEIRKEIRARYQVHMEAPLVITLSGNTYNKGVHLLTEAWPEIQKEIPSCRWLICGPMTEYLRKRVFAPLARGGLQKTTGLSGNLDKFGVLEHLLAADLNVNTTLGEGLNMVVAESAALGIPSVSSDAAGIAVWLGAFRAGMVVPCGESKPLAQTVVKYFQNDDLKIFYRENCLRMANDFFIENVANRLLRLFNQPEA
jgi:glycosyltransferase involved in cell wall biosynthesis